VPKWRQIGARTIPISLSIKNVPDDVAARLRARAERNHRSLQGELMAILENATAESGRLTPAEVLAAVRALGLSTPSEAVDIVRRARDSR